MARRVRLGAMIRSEGEFLLVEATDQYGNVDREVEIVLEKSEPEAELVALREMADAWEEYSTCKGSEILAAQSRHVRAVEAIRALRKGAGGG